MKQPCNDVQHHARQSSQKQLAPSALWFFLIFRSTLLDLLQLTMFEVPGTPERVAISSMGHLSTLYILYIYSFGSPASTFLLAARFRSELTARQT